MRPGKISTKQNHRGKTVSTTQVEVNGQSEKAQIYGADSNYVVMNILHTLLAPTVL